MAQSSNKSKLRAIAQKTYVIPNDDSPKIIHNLLSMILGEFHFLSYYFSACELPLLTPPTVR